MGVDYDAEFGLGTRIHKIKGKTIEEINEAFGDEGKFEGCDDGLTSYIESLVQTQDGVVYSETGDSSYTGNTPEFYLYIEAPDFNNLEKLKEQIENFGAAMKRLEMEGNPISVCGGLHVW